jgi:hypothetical protein
LCLTVFFTVFGILKFNLGSFKFPGMLFNFVILLNLDVELLRLPSAKINS